MSKSYKLSDLSEGMPVQCHSFGKWYAGTVVSVGRTRATVRYRTGSGKERDKAFPPWYLVPPGTYAEGKMGEPQPERTEEG